MKKDDSQRTFNLTKTALRAGDPGLCVVSLTLGNTAHGPGCRTWVIWPENTMTWPKSRSSALQNPPPIATRADPESNPPLPLSWAKGLPEARRATQEAFPHCTPEASSKRASEIWPFVQMLNKSCTTAHAIFDQAQFAQMATTIRTFQNCLFGWGPILARG